MTTRSPRIETTERWWFRHLSLRDVLALRLEQIRIRREARTLPVRPVWGVRR